MPEQAYVDALLADLALQLEFVQGRPLHSIFFGGGTPSLFSANAIDQILSGVNKRIPFDNDIEITLEANPGTFEQDKFAAYHSAGINRLSIGIQSFNAQHLKRLGRIHNSEEAIVASAKARAAGFENFNLDLMHGLENQNTDQAMADLQQAIDLGAQHISWYQLTIEPNTAFYKTPPIIPHDDQLADIQSAGEALLHDHGYDQYEVSAFSKKAKQSKHNLNYWQFGDYIGIGAGAHGKLTDTAYQRIFRQWQTRSPKDYLDTNKAFCAGSRTLCNDELPLEFMMNALRLNNGFDIHLFQQRTGLYFSNLEHATIPLLEKGLIELNQHNLAPTALGRRFLNDILEAF